MEEMCRTRYGEGSQSFHALSEGTTLTESPCVQQPGSFLKPVISEAGPFGFLGRIYYMSMIH